MILIRTNLSLKVGLGHYMRMIRLAKKLSQKKLIFVIDKPNEEFEEKKYKHLYLYKDDTFQNELKDSNKILLIIKKYKVKTIIVDDYRLGLNWEKNIKKNSNLKLIVFDDFYNRKHNCDFYFNSKILNKTEINELRFNLSNKTKLFLGPRYAIINPNLKKNIFIKEKKNITFYAGGGGNPKIFYNVIKNLCYSKNKNIQINLIVSLNKNYLNKYFHLKKKFKKFNIFFRNNYDEVINNTNLFIGCQGNSIYENSYLKKLSILFPISVNQINKNDDLFSLGHFFIIKKKYLKNYEKLSELILKILGNLKKLTHESFKEVNLVDNLGIKRISEAILNQKKNSFHQAIEKKGKDTINIKRVTLKDIHSYLNARNLNQNRSNMINQKKIKLFDHYIWWLSNDFSSRETYKLYDSDNRILLFIWHKKIKINKRNYYVGGWFVNSSYCKISDVYSALRWQIQTTKINKIKWICAIKKNNKTVKKMNKLLGFVDKFKDKTDLQNSKKYFKAISSQFRYLIRYPI